MNNVKNQKPVFTLPVEIFTAYCQSNTALVLPIKSGATPGTTLFGSFGDILLDNHCQQKQNCLHNRAEFECKLPQTCPLKWLFKPYSDIHHRHFPRPIFMYSRELENRVPVTHFKLHITLWGQHAIQQKTCIQQSLITLAEKGFLLNSQPQSFQISHFSTSKAQSLEELITPYSQQAINSVLFLFETPLRYREKVRHPNGKTESFWQAAGEPPIRELIANSAYELAAWQLEDSQQTQIDKQQRHQHCQQIKHSVVDLLEKTYPDNWLLYPASVGQRYSKSEQKEFQLDGFRGFTELKGDLNAALPWLIALALQGGGQNRAMGFGRIRLILNGQTISH